MATVHDLLWRRIPDAYPARGRRWHEAALARALQPGRPLHRAGPRGRRRPGAGGRLGPIDHRDPHGIGPPARRPTPTPPPPHLARLGVTGPFLLCVGTLEPRKNLQRLVAAYGTIRDALPEPWPLVMVGPSGWGEQVRPDHRRRPGRHRVRRRNCPGSTRSARLLAYVPLIEGFGLPPVEAMSVGTPVVASPLPSTGGRRLRGRSRPTPRRSPPGCSRWPPTTPTREQLVRLGGGPLAGAGLGLHRPTAPGGLGSRHRGGTGTGWLSTPTGGRRGPVAEQHRSASPSTSAPCPNSRWVPATTSCSSPGHLSRRPDVDLVLLAGRGTATGGRRWSPRTTSWRQRPGRPAVPARLGAAPARAAVPAARAPTSTTAPTTRCPGVDPSRRWSPSTT